MKKKCSLKALNTFRMDVQAASLAVIQSEKDLQALLPLPESYMILGGGSNVLFTQDLDGLVIQNQIKGLEIIEETNEHVLLRIGGGEVWHETVLWAIERDYGGIENMSLIPGSVGAAPMQNIGAYGVEIKDVFHSLEAVHLQTGKIETFDSAACEFGYRESIFKRKLKNQYCITRVILKLSRQHQYNISYGAVKAVLDASKEALSIRAISNAIIKIRNQKLPNPKVLPNSGSFFKNPIVPIAQFEALKATYPQMPSYPVSETEVKLAAGWLIDSLGFKGYRKGDAGVHQNQALVLVNYGNAKGAEIWALAQEIQKKVADEYGIDLHAEVNVV